MVQHDQHDERERKAEYGTKENGPLSKVLEDLHSASRVMLLTC